MIAGCKLAGTLRQLPTVVAPTAQPGGRVVLVIPALRALYGTIDRAIGHYRRYSRRERALQARLHDRLVPLLRVERRFRPPFGMSLLAVGRAE
jgi:hypothetical protein